jgi:hypothetical protein
MASTHALESTSPGDSRYTAIEAQLTSLGQRRDALAITIKNELFAAEFNATPISEGTAMSQTTQAQTMIQMAQQLAAS